MRIVDANAIVCSPVWNFVTLKPRPIDAGARVRVSAVDGLRVVVEPAE